MNQEEEISLREIIDVLWKGKWLIAIITAVAVLAAGVYSFIISDEVYKGKATVSSNQISTVPEGVQSYITDMTKPEVFQQTLQSSTVIQQVIDEVGLETSIGSLQQRIQVELPSDDNGAFITVSLEGTDRDEIKSIIDTAISITKEEMDSKIKSRLDLLAQEYMDKMNEEDEKLTSAVQEFNDMRAGENLPALILFEENAGAGQFILDGNDDLIRELRDLDKTDQIEYQKINDKIENFTTLFTFYKDKYDEVMSIQSMNIMDMNLDVMSDTFVPQQPVAPNKMLNVAIALVLGIMIGVGIVFLRSYLKEEPLSKENK